MRIKKGFTILLYLKLTIFGVLLGALLIRSFGLRAEAETDVDVSKNTRTIVLKDSDGDGILDGEDPHPDVAEIYIVEDEDKNGIVDIYEE